MVGRGDKLRASSKRDKTNMRGSERSRRRRRVQGQDTRQAQQATGWDEGRELTKRRKRDIEERRKEALNSMWTGRKPKDWNSVSGAQYAQLPVFEAARKKGFGAEMTGPGGFGGALACSGGGL